MARPNPPGVSSTPLGRGFLFLFQTLRGAGTTRSICFKRREKVARSSGGARRAGSEGERGRGKACEYGNNLRVGSREQDVAQTGRSGAGLARSLGCRPESGASPRLAWESKSR